MSGFMDWANDSEPIVFQKPTKEQWIKMLVDLLSQPRDYTPAPILVGKDTYDLMQADLRGDKAEREAILGRIRRKNKEHRQEEYRRLLARPDVDFSVYWKIDRNYKRADHLTRDILYTSNYHYEWYAGFQMEFKEYGFHDVRIVYEKGRYSLCLWYSDESGYDQDELVIEKDIDPSLILTKIKDYEKNGRRERN